MQIRSHTNHLCLTFLSVSKNVCLGQNTICPEGSKHTRVSCFSSFVWASIFLRAPDDIDHCDVTDVI